MQKPFTLSKVSTVIGICSTLATGLVFAIGSITRLDARITKLEDNSVYSQKDIRDIKQSLRDIDDKITNQGNKMDTFFQSQINHKQ